MNLARKHLTSGSSMVAAIMAANFLNFLFNSILGRQLSFEDFGLVTLAITFYYFSGIFTAALAATINFKTSHLLAEGKKAEAANFFSKTMKGSAIVAVIATIIWLLTIPFLMSFFKVQHSGVFYAFAPVLILSTITYSIVGYFQGSLKFHWAGAVSVAEPITKLIVALAVIALGVGYSAYIALPFSLIISSLVGMLALTLVNAGLRKSQTKSTFPKKFFIVALVSGITSTLFFSVDIIMVKHFFSNEVTGQYALLSLIGKMVFFFCTLVNIFTLPLAIRAKSKKETEKLFLMLVGGTALLGLIGWLGLGLAGEFFIPLLFGEKARAILPLVSNYTFAIVLFAVSAITVSFYIARQHYIFVLAPIAAALTFCSLIYFHHHSLAAITANILWTCVSLFIALVLGHLYYQKYGVAYEK